MTDVPALLQGKPVIPTLKDGITICRVSLMYEGFKLVKQILAESVDRKTVLFLSGGRTPKDLYENLANDKKVTPGAVALIDERYGSKLHNNSNEKMIQETGFLPYIDSINVPFYPILQKDHPDLIKTADNYDMTVRYLFAGFPKSVGILGIGTDGHTAGLPANRKLWEEGISETSKDHMVTSYSDLEGFYKERVTMTSLGLSMLDLYIVLVFGEDKKQALELVFSEGSEEDVPGRFYKRPEIAKRTLLITDQKV